MKKFNLLVLAVICVLCTSAQTVATFENLTLAPNSYYNGSDMAGGFASGNVFLPNSYDTAWGGSWSGFAYSNTTDVTTAGVGNQYSAITGGGYNGSANYAISSGFSDRVVRVTGSATGGYVNGVYITNATYAYLSMKDGDQFAKKFGGVTGNDPDFFKLTIKGWKNGALIADSVDFLLADFTFADNSLDYIVNTWEWVNLQTLGNVDSLNFALSSSDNGQFGMNTPGYFALDNFTTADELNVAPVVVTASELIVTNYNTPVIINVTDNFFDTTAAPLTVTSAGPTQILGSTVTITPNSELEYTPETGIVAVDTVPYTVCDDAGLCVSSSVIITVTGLTGLNDVQVNTVNVFPNPFGNQLNVKATEAIAELGLFDLNGRLMSTAVIINGANASINTSELAKGTYVVKTVSANGTSFTKVSK